MYPSEELKRLATRKVTLRRSIAVHRLQCTRSAAQAGRPLQWLDRLLGLWDRFSPLTKFAALPLGFLARRLISPRSKWLGSLIRWMPLFSGVAGTFFRRKSASRG